MCPFRPKCVTFEYFSVARDNGAAAVIVSRARAISITKVYCHGKREARRIM